MKYKIIAVIGPSGCGKSNLLNEVCRFASDRVNKVIGVTTRPKRQGEIKGKDYYFLTKDEFANELSSGNIIGWAQFNDWFYATRLSDLSLDKPNIGVFNPKAIEKLNAREDIDLTIIYLHTSGKERLLRQLNREDAPDVDEIVRRYQADKEDFLYIYREYLCIHMDNESPEDLKLNARRILDLIP